MHAEANRIGGHWTNWTVHQDDHLIRDVKLTANSSNC